MSDLSQNMNEKSDLTFERLAVSLADDYESLYVINGSDDSYVEYAVSGSDKKLVKRSEGEDFYSDTRVNTRRLIYPEDQERFLDAFRKETIEEVLSNGKSFHLDYRLVIDGVPLYYHLKTIRARTENDDYIIIGVQNVDEQVRARRKADEERLIYSEIAQSFAVFFEVIYHVDVNTDNYAEYSSSENFSHLGLKTEGVDFFGETQRLIVDIIHPDDYPKVAEAMQKERLLAALDETGSFSMTYRQMLDGKQQYVILIALRQKSTPDHIVIGVRNINDQVQHEQTAAAELETYTHIANALASRYEVIYHINTENNSFTQYSSSEQYAKLGTVREGDDFFAVSAADISRYIYPDDRQRLLKSLSKEQLLADLAQTGTVTLTYRQMLGGRPQYVSMLVVQPKNDPKRIVVGVFNIDAQIRREQSMARESEAFSEIVRALAFRYEVIYQVDLTTDEYWEYSSSEKYAQLKAGMHGLDFFGDTQRNMRDEIYPDDYPKMARAMQRDVLLRNLTETGSMTLNYRLMLDGRPQYVTLFAIRPMLDSNHIIVAVENVDVIKRREMAFKEALGSAIDLASRDALTGVKNKHAYVQAEIELDELIADRLNPDFSLVIADINGLKYVNDFRGHSAGDDYIKAACALICRTFKHSPVYRIGGDEFAVVLKGQDYDQRESLVSDFDMRMKENNARGEVSVAVGLSTFDPMGDLRVQDVFERADKAMYENKKLFIRPSDTRL